MRIVWIIVTRAGSVTAERETVWRLIAEATGVFNLGREISCADLGSHGLELLPHIQEGFKGIELIDLGKHALTCHEVRSLIDDLARGHHVERGVHLDLKALVLRLIFSRLNVDNHAPVFLVGAKPVNKALDFQMRTRQALSYIKFHCVNLEHSRSEALPIVDALGTDGHPCVALIRAIRCPAREPRLMVGLPSEGLTNHREEVILPLLDWSALIVVLQCGVHC